MVTPGPAAQLGTIDTSSRIVEASGSSASSSRMVTLSRKFSTFHHMLSPVLEQHGSPRGSLYSMSNQSPSPQHLPISPTSSTVTTNQTSFLGRRVSQTILSAEDRIKVIEGSRRERTDRDLLLGETDANLQPMWTDRFEGELLLDGADDRHETRRVLAKVNQLRKDKRSKDKSDSGSIRDGWQTRLGWDKTTPRRRREDKGTTASIHSRSSRASQKSLKRHRSRRVMRNLDADLDTYNAYTQNGLTPLTRSRSSATAKTPSLQLAASNNHSLLSVNSALTTTSIYSSIIEGDAVNPSLYSWSSDLRGKAVPIGDGFDSLDIMADHIFRIGVQRKKWFAAPKMGSQDEGVGTGVAIRAKTGLYRIYPVNYPLLDEFEDAIIRLNPEVAIKVDSQIVRNIVRTYIEPSPTMGELIIDANTRIQVLDEVSHLARARKHQYAAFIRKERCLCVWADVVEAIIPAAEALEEALLEFIWKGEEENRKINQAMRINDCEEKVEDGEYRTEEMIDPEDSETRKLRRYWKARPSVLYAPVMDGLAVICVLALVGWGIRTMITEYILDGAFWRFSLLLFVPGLICVSSFACMVLVGSFFQALGPVRQCTSNSTYYSGVAPRRTMGELDHVTIQMPVYKESLEDVIKPTVESLKRAMTTYERQGGSCSILCCDDGLQLLSPEEASKRKAFYFDNNIAYVARPGHGQNGFIRKGRFKKAGNLNYANRISLRVEELLDEIRPIARAMQAADAFWGENEENAIYDQALSRALDECKGEAWAAGNIRIGRIILIIDSDTRVPEDCFADAVSEMAESPEVAIIQHASGVMQVANHFFEDGVSHFTRGIQTSISYCCASGEVAPFVGHNAFLRWSALQECLHVDPDDEIAKIWSEDHVSEDFQISVTLQMKGYICRWASYSAGEFEEGVSLTCDDELNRWQKYAYGCSELLFHPFGEWWRKGPVTPLYRNFLWSEIPLHSKFTISGYIFSYYAIAMSWFMTIVNYFIEGWNVPLDGYYLTSWNVFIVCVLLFVGVANIAFVTLRYRLKLPNAGQMSIDQIKWIPFFAIFFTGMSMPMSMALGSHLIGYNMTWSSTIKSVERSNFFLQLPIIWRRFWPQLSFFGLVIATMIVFACVPAIPTGWRIYTIEVLVPTSVMAGSHLLYPFALNPWFLSFSF